jgi:hypothetical protein
LLGPRDLGRGFQVAGGAARALVDATPCLAGLGASGVQVGRAATALNGSGPGGVPAVTELLASYPASAAAPVFGSVNATLESCPTFAITVAGTRVVVPLNAGTMPLIGNASREYGGEFRLAGRAERLDVAVVLDGDVVLAVVYVDGAATSSGPGLAATVRAAVAKLT